MSTVTLSKPHCAITSAENPEGIASQAFTTALPEAHTFLTLFDTIFSFPFAQTHRHCEEPTGPASGGPDDKLRDEAIQSFASGFGLLRGACHRAALCADPLARNDAKITPRPAVSSPRPRRPRARYSLSPPRYRQARARRFWCARRAFLLPARPGSARHRRP